MSYKIEGELLSGSPCKSYSGLTESISFSDTPIYGRYIGMSKSYSNILIICTPYGSIFYCIRSNIYFNLTDEDLSILKEYESIAIENNQWYHKSLNITDSNSVISYSDISPL